mmetsp:Transcript_5783/g.10022  ORF Transcript_5783/g.10022 Transcript_5783/m.10022 type:complete len:113 (-) Transcript_5783:96-434(-)
MTAVYKCQCEAAGLCLWGANQDGHGHVQKGSGTHGGVPHLLEHMKASFGTCGMCKAVSHPLEPVEVSNTWRKMQRHSSSVATCKGNMHLLEHVKSFHTCQHLLKHMKASDAC